ncbi:TonB-dependent Receptor Plug Domain protein [Luteitalea pratensis]|uniref:TonB-dependent Receptor Plug Domain protein n=1 Tax=Luteitalea pratensis TaxID=1855912 RepID=A0A143PTT0_LUTPR|nr:carboxypeptidase regulatory-like domain-containing protein [Luteitalea pratensis]AMY11746.1 TonB-dependent Receptor Plug Domain protein [Luteitalea pratensis]
MIRTITRVALMALLVAAGAGGLQAQTTTGGLTGVIRDSDGGVVPGATVNATATATGTTLSAVTDEAGQYLLRGLPVGTYKVQVELAGFQTVHVEGVVIRVNEEVRTDIVLKVGNLTESVTVSGISTTVDTVSSTLKTVVDQKRIEELPLNGRNPTQLMTLVAGVIPDNRANVTSGATYPGATGISSNGARANSTNYIMDGGSNNDHYSNASNPMPNPDALQEFSVQTNSFSAQYGRNAGAIVNAVTRSGTNSFRGLAFGYLRDKSMNANNFFTPGKDDGLNRKQFGGTFGGPVIKNKTFFFGSYQGTLQDQRPADRTALVPTAAQRNGDFSGYSRVLRDPLTGQPFPGNVIPANRIHPAAAAVLGKYLPLPNPNAGDPVNTLRFASPANLDDHQYLARVDHTFSSNHRLYGRYWKSKASTPAYLDTANVLTSSFGRTWDNQIISANDTWVISPSLVNNVVFTHNRTYNDNFQIDIPSYADLGIPGVYNDATPQWFFNVPGWFNINTGDTNQFNRDEYQLLNTLRWTKGRHEIATGVDYSYGKGDIINNFRANGRYTFNNSAPFTGDAMADFLLGEFQSFEQGVGEYKNTRFHYLAAFAEDTWRVNPRVTLTMGLRWDPNVPYTDANGRLAGYRPGQESQVYTNAPVGMLYPGDAGFPDGGYDSSWGLFAPRVGGAWDVTGDGKTSIRAGYGLFYDKPNSITTNSAANVGPFGTVARVDGNATTGFDNTWGTATNPFPVDVYNVPSDAPVVLPFNAFSYAADMRPGKMHSWHVTGEREIFKATMLRVAYAGSRGDGLTIGIERNPAIYAPGATTGTTNQRRPLFPDYGTITSIEPLGKSTFHSLQVTVDKRLSGGLSLLSNYTLSKSTDNSSQSKQTGTTAVNPFDLSYDWGPAEFDRRHRWVTSLLWQIPGQFDNAAVNAVLADWNLTGIYTIMSGQPFTVTSGVDNARSGTGTQFADQVGDPELSSDRPKSERLAQWFNTSAFTVNALGTFGNAGRNSLRGPDFQTLDLGLHKTFSITNRVRTQFRLEAFNALNRANFNLPEGNRSSSNFGRITAANAAGGGSDPRILQLALRTWF